MLCAVPIIQYSGEGVTALAALAMGEAADTMAGGWLLAAVRVVGFPLTVWLLEIVEGYLLIAVYGHNPAWTYTTPDAMFHGNIRTGYAPYVPPSRAPPAALAPCDAEGRRGAPSQHVVESRPCRRVHCTAARARCNGHAVDTLMDNSKRRLSLMTSVSLDHLLPFAHRLPHA